MLITLAGPSQTRFYIPNGYKGLKFARMQKMEKPRRMIELMKIQYSLNSIIDQNNPYINAYTGSFAPVVAFRAMRCGRISALLALLTLFSAASLMLCDGINTAEPSLTFERRRLIRLSAS